MNRASDVDVIVGVGLHDRPGKSAWPARMDVAQSLSALALFMWGHMAFVSSILFSNDAMCLRTTLSRG